VEFGYPQESRELTQEQTPAHSSDFQQKTALSSPALLDESVAGLYHRSMDLLPVKLSSRVRQAVQFAAIRHKDQKDKAGKPYIAHCFRVALAVWHCGEDYFIAGILHDTVEDTATTLDEIENLFGKSVRNAVDSVSRREFPKKESYEDFVLRSKADPIGRIVKIADLYDNMSPERRPEPPVELDKKLERYEKALAVLTSR
jgi:(p)ppGpp synthase/HD superfamily hydrolase